MAPLREYLCDYCGHQFEETVWSSNPEEYRAHECPHCESMAKLLPALIGGYNGNTGGSSTTPRGSGSRKSKKAYTGKPGSVDEPQVEAKKLEESDEPSFPPLGKIYD